MPNPSPAHFSSKSAADIMTANPVCFSPGMTIREVARKFEEKGISGAPVVDATGRLVGVVSRTDLVKRYTEDDNGCNPATLIELFGGRVEGSGTGPSRAPLLAAADFMNTEPVTAAPTSSVCEVAQKMVQARIHRVIIVDADRKPIGIVTSLDLVRGLASL